MPEYRDIAGNPGYRVGDDGSIWSAWTGGRSPRIGNEWRQMKPVQQKYGHHLIGMRGKVFRYVHHLVLEAFVGPRPEGHECRHLNGNASDNRLENLAWGTSLENTLDCHKHGKMSRGSTHGAAKLAEPIVANIWQRLQQGERDEVLAKEHGVSPATITAIRRGFSWNHVTGASSIREKYYQRSKTTIDR